jgi:hypothetical protein
MAKMCLSRQKDERDMNIRTPEERILEALEDVRSEELGELLASVNRIAEGVGAIQQLAIEITGPAAPRGDWLLDDDEQNLLHSLRGVLGLAVADDTLAIHISRNTLSRVLRLIDRRRPTI